MPPLAKPPFITKHGTHFIANRIQLCNGLAETVRISGVHLHQGTANPAANDGFDLNEGQPTLHWQEVNAQGVKRPGAISNHTSVIYNKKMYLFGGSNGLNSNETFYAFDPATNMWEIVRHKPADNDEANKPPASDEHSAVVSGDHMYIFGGFDGGDRIN